MRWAASAELMVERRGAYRVSLGKAEGKGPFRRPRHRREDNIKMDFQKVGWGHELDRSS